MKYFFRFGFHFFRLAWSFGPNTIGDSLTNLEQSAPIQNILGKICLLDSECAPDEQCLAPFSGALTGLVKPSILTGFSLISFRICSPRLTPPGFDAQSIAAEQAYRYPFPISEIKSESDMIFQQAEDKMQPEGVTPEGVTNKSQMDEGRQSEQLFAGTVQSVAGVTNSITKAIPTNLLDGISLPQAPLISCRAFQRDLFVGETTTINAKGFVNDLFNVTLIDRTNPDSVLIHVKELQTLAKVPGVFQFSCDTAGVFPLKFKVFATDVGGGILGKGFKICRSSISCVQRPPINTFSSHDHKSYIPFFSEERRDAMTGFNPLMERSPTHGTSTMEDQRLAAYKMYAHPQRQVEEPPQVLDVMDALTEAFKEARKGIDLIDGSEDIDNVEYDIGLRGSQNMYKSDSYRYPRIDHPKDYQFRDRTPNRGALKSDKLSSSNHSDAPAMMENSFDQRPDDVTGIDRRSRSQNRSRRNQDSDEEDAVTYETITTTTTTTTFVRTTAFEEGPKISCHELRVDAKVERSISLSLPGTLFTVSGGTPSLPPITRVLIPGHEGDANNFAFTCRESGMVERHAVILAQSQTSAASDFRNCPMTIFCRKNNPPRVECRQDLLLLSARPNATITLDVSGDSNDLFNAWDIDGDGVTTAVQDTKTAKVKFAVHHRCPEEGVAFEQYLVTAYDGEDHSTAVCKVRFECEKD